MRDDGRGMKPGRDARRLALRRWGAGPLLRADGKLGVAQMPVLAMFATVIDHVFYSSPSTKEGLVLQ